jgi:hypothetical protein
LESSSFADWLVPDAIRHKTTASKIIKSQNKIVRTVEFTLLPHPLDALKPSVETFEAGSRYYVRCTQEPRVCTRAIRLAGS